VQIVGYRAGPDDPELVVASDGAVERVPLTRGKALDYPLGERHCAGVVDDRTHYACDREATPYCDRHDPDWAPTYTDEEYAIYLAAFAPATFKVGITRSWRLDTRLREQGADRAAHIETAPSGPIARNREREIATTLPEAVRVDRKIDGLATSFDEKAWRNLLDRYALIETFRFDYGFALTNRPIGTTLATGTVRGTKGRVLVLDWAGSTYATDLRDLVGWEIAGEQRKDSHRQASLGAFRS
jgi:hypothetical protein